MVDESLVKFIRQLVRSEIARAIKDLNGNNDAGRSRNPGKPDKERYSVKEMADRLDRSERTIRRYAEQGRLRGVDCGMINGNHAWNFSHEELIRFRNEGTRRTDNDDDDGFVN